MMMMMSLCYTHLFHIAICCYIFMIYLLPRYVCMSLNDGGMNGCEWNMIAYLHACYTQRIRCNNIISHNFSDMFLDLYIQKVFVKYTEDNRKILFLENSKIEKEKLKSIHSNTIFPMHNYFTKITSFSQLTES